MSFQEIVASAKTNFPKLKIKYKNESYLMLFISKLLGNDFTGKYITVIGYTIYFPNRKFILNHPESASVALLHEIVHLHNKQKLEKYFL